MILEFQIQSLAILLSLCESLHPTRIRQRCVGFIPMVLSPIGFLRFRFRHETFRFLFRNIYELAFSKSKKRFQTRIWDPGDDGSDCTEYRIKNRLWPDLTHSIFDEEESRRWPLDFPEWVLVYLSSQTVYVDVISDLKRRVKFKPNCYYKSHNRLIIRCCRPSLVFYPDRFLLEILSTNSLLWPQTWVIRQRKIPNDRREPLQESSNILISTKRQDTVLSPTTLSSHFKSKVMLKAFWSLSSKLITNNKYVKEGHNRFIC